MPALEKRLTDACSTSMGLTMLSRTLNPSASQWETSESELLSRRGEWFFMDDAELLREEFLRHGKAQGLNEEFLESVLAFLLRNQFYPAGERQHVRQHLLKLIKNQQDVAE